MDFVGVTTMEFLDSVFSIILWSSVALGAYFLPAILANIRKVPNQGSVLVINAFLGWTLIGWVVALAMAARSAQVPVQDAPPGSRRHRSWTLTR